MVILRLGMAKIVGDEREGACIRAYRIIVFRYLNGVLFYHY